MGTKKASTIVDAFFEMYGYSREKKDVLIYNGKRESLYVKNTIKFVFF